MDSIHKKSQKPNIIAPKPTRIKFDSQRINLKKAQPSLFIIRFLNEPRRFQQCHEELKGPVMPSETSLTKRSLIHLHKAANSTFQNMHIQKEKKKSCGLFFKRRCSFKIKNRSSSRVSKIQNFQNSFSNCA